MNATSGFGSLGPEVQTTARGMPQECIAFLQEHCTVESFRKGDVVLSFMERDPPFLMCVEGLLLAETPHLDGDEFLPTKFLNAGSSLPVAGGAQASALQVRALSAGTVAKLPSAALEAACAEWAEFSRSYSAALVRSMLGLNLRLVLRGVVGLELSMGALLWSVSGGVVPKNGGDLPVPYAITQETLGLYFGVTREEINRKFKLMEVLGYLERNRAGLVLKGPLFRALALAGVAPEEPGFGHSFLPFIWERMSRESLCIDEYFDIAEEDLAVS